MPIKLKGKTFYREITLRDIPKDAETIELSFSSAEPVHRGRYIEILGHEEKEIDFSRLNTGASLLVNHDPDKLAGVVERAELGADKKARATVRFGKSAYAQEIRKDVLDGIRKFVSVGYEIDDIKEQGEKGGVPILRATKWTPYEISLVSIPADITVGVGRNKPPEEIPEEAPEEAPAAEIKTTQEVEIKMPDTNELEKARKDEAKRIREIYAAADKLGKYPYKKDFSIKDEVQRHIDTGLSINDFVQVAMSAMTEPAELRTENTGETGLTPQEARSFSFLNALRGITTDTWDGAGFEREVMITAKNKTRAKGMVIPEEVLRQRVLLGTAEPVSSTSDSFYVTNATGSHLVGTDHLAGSFIDLLRNNLMVKKLGATVLSGLKGDVSIPKQIAGVAAQWFTESAVTQSYETHYQALTGQTPSFTSIPLAPKYIAVEVPVTARLMHQSSPDVENLIRNDLAFAIAAGVDYAALYGGSASGLNGSPTGLAGALTPYTVENSGTGTSISLTFGDIVGLETAISTANADIPRMAYLTSARGRGFLKQTLKVAASTFADFLWSVVPGQFGVGEMNGYLAYVSNQVINNYTSTIQAAKGAINTNLFFGNWGDLIIGEWGGIEIMVDDNTYFGQGASVLKIRRMCDIAIRRNESFAFVDEFSA